VSSEHSESSADVSVIIPAYQAENTIARALDSVLAQTVLPAEVIVIDDGSRDRTREIVDAYVGRETPCTFHLIEQKNLGAGAARNRGLLASDSRLVAFLDADDEWLPEKLSRSLMMLDLTAADLVSHDITRSDGDTTSYVSCAHHFNRRPDPLMDYFLRGYISTSTVVVRRQLLLDAGGFDPSLRAGQDYELWLAAISMAGKRHHVFAEALTHYHVTPNSITSQAEQRRRAAVRILHRHLPVLRGRSRYPRFVGVMRAAIICLQAVQAHRAAGNIPASISVIFRLPIHVVLIMASRLSRTVERPDFLTGEKATE
jgi:teichuronic acid biosynthesis glycosyltransferase TuaG